MIRFKYILLLFLLPVFSEATTVTDSLKTLLAKASSDTAKVKALLELAEDARSYNNDEALKYVEDALVLANKLSPKTFEVNAIVKKALILKNKGRLNEALNLLLLAYNKSTTLKYYRGKIKALNNLGTTYSEIGNRQKANEYYLAGIKIAELANDKKSLISFYVNVGVEYMTAKQYPTAIDYLNKAKKNATELNELYSLGSISTNLGSIYELQEKYDSALISYNSGLEYYRQANYVEGIALTYYYFGVVHKERGDLVSALASYKRAYVLIDSLKADSEKPNLLLNIAEIEMSTKHGKEALQHITMAMNLAKEFNFMNELKESYNLMSEVCEASGNYKDALLYQSLFYKLKDSLGGSESNKSFFEMQTKYESEKKQKAIEQLNNNKKLQEAKFESQKTQQYAMLIVIALFIVLVVFITIAFINKKKDNKTLSAQKTEIQNKNEALNKLNGEIVARQKEIESKNEELNQQNEEIAAQRDEIENQKHLIEHKQKEVLDSINYAQKIQQTLLPSIQEIKSVFADSFVIYKPKDIVAGDFYWMYHTPSLLGRAGEGPILLATADCTGHGVPGAFMSMLGMSFLNEIVAESKITQPDLVLNKLRDNIIKAISSQKFSDREELKDGMDMTLIVYDTETKQMQISAANNSLYVLRPAGKKGLINNKKQMLPFATTSNGALYEVKANKFPIGKQNEILEPFTLNTIQLEEGDSVVLYTDGYADQFGGDFGKKFKYKQLEEILITNSNLSMSEQSKILDNKFEEWKGALEQVDDVTIIGIRI